MNRFEIEAIRKNKHTVTVEHPDSGEVRTVAFNDDAKAVEFMERASHQGFTIIECEGPSS